MITKGRRKGTYRFVLQAVDGAKKAELAGTFNEWAPQPMRLNKDGQFIAEVPMAKGTYEYKFVVDGKWILDPDCSDIAANDVGTFNSVFRVK